MALLEGHHHAEVLLTLSKTSTSDENLRPATLIYFLDVALFRVVQLNFLDAVVGPEYSFRSFW